MNRARFCDLFKETILKKPQYLSKVEEFVRRKVERPMEKYNAKDTPFISAGLYGKTGLGLRHAHFSQDDSIVYRVHGSPTMVDIYGIFSHKDLGTGDTSNIQTQKRMAKKFQNQVFEQGKSNEC